MSFLQGIIFSDFILNKTGETELTLFSPEKKHKEPWSPKQKIWSGGGGGKNEKKRKAEEARLSSNEESSSKKRLDSKASSITGSSGEPRPPCGLWSDNLSQFQ